MPMAEIASKGLQTLSEVPLDRWPEKAAVLRMALRAGQCIVEAGRMTHADERKRLRTEAVTLLFSIRKLVSDAERAGVLPKTSETCRALCASLGMQPIADIDWQRWSRPAVRASFVEACGVKGLDDDREPDEDEAKRKADDILIDVMMMHKEAQKQGSSATAVSDHIRYRQCNDRNQTRMAPENIRCSAVVGHREMMGVASNAPPNSLQRCLESFLEFW